MREIDLGGTVMEVHYGINAITDIEKELDISIVDLLQRSGDVGPSIREVVVVLWAGLRAKRRGVTLEQTGKWLDDVPNILPVAQACGTWPRPSSPPRWNPCGTWAFSWNGRGNRPSSSPGRCVSWWGTTSRASGKGLSRSWS
ncbi:MAG TPA: hypothetical protein PK393_09215 [Synergistaceae bacterium]|jgi:hypothetical protein|nr:hypothetical protein [Synergistaceae bacterium]